MTTIGVIGGSGLYDLDFLTPIAEHRPQTSFGATSAAIVEAKSGEHRLLFLPRHAPGHTTLPSEVPYAANIAALKTLGVSHVLSVSACGGLVEEYGPGRLVMPDQFIDRTTGRRSTFFGAGVVGHVSMADPTCSTWRDFIHGVAVKIDSSAHNGGTYVCIDGPQFSSRAESNMFRAWGGHLIGMTNATEAKLAREASLCYASLCFVTDYDCWKTDEAPVTLEQILAVMSQNIGKGKTIIGEVVKNLAALPACAEGDPKQAIVTSVERRNPQTMRALAPILEAGR